MDALRAFAMLLGVFLHAALFLFSGNEWPVHDEWAHATALQANPYAYLVSVIHGFRMPVFFVLSGFFTAMQWQSRGLHRLKRVGLPLLLSIFTIIPINTWIFEGRGFHPLSDWPVAWLDGFDHLWFLWYLLLMMVAFGIFAQLNVQFRHPLWWLLIPLALVSQCFMQEAIFGADALSPPLKLLPPLHLFVYYAAFFFFGAFFHQRNFGVRRWWAAAIPLSVILIFPAAVVLLYPQAILGWEPIWAWPIAAVLQVAYAWLMSFGLMGLFRWIAGKGRFWIRYVSDSSYWVYLWHLPLVVLGQMLVVSWPVIVHLKFVLICVTVVAVLLVVYQAGVRYTLIGAMLNGPRSRRHA